jgi:hypothetical protein
METLSTQYHKSDEPIVLSKPLLDLLLKQKAFSALLALYTFYYYTAKWQGTNQPKATNSYVASGLNWSLKTVKKHKQSLKKLGLIKTVVRKHKTTGKVLGFYVSVQFIWTHEKALEATKNEQSNQWVTEYPTGTQNQRGKLATDGKSTPQMLEGENKKNALNSITKKNLQKRKKFKQIGKLKRTKTKLQPKSKKPTIADRNKIFKPIAIKLSKIICSTKSITHSSQQIKTWTNELRRLNEENSIGRHEMLKTLQWYAVAVGGEFIPVVESGKAFREKYVKLLAAIDRENRPKPSQKMSNTSGWSEDDPNNAMYLT